METILTPLILTGLVSLVLASLIGTLVTPLIVKLYMKQKWLDDPNTKHVKKVHDRPLPRGGGLVIGAALFATIPLFIPLNAQVIAILLACALLVAVGTLDDIFDIHPFWRLGAGLVAGLLVVLNGIGTDFVSNPFGPGVLWLNQWQLQLGSFTFTTSLLPSLLAIIFIIWNMNIVNWSKGVDGQMPGFVAISALFIGLLSLRFAPDPSQWSVFTLSCIVAGAFVGFLIWNWYPQKIMAGYGAGSLAGFLLSVLAILSGAKVATALMVLAIPTADAIFTVTRRLWAGKSPWWGDRGHLHHKLMDVLGWGRRRVAVFYWLTSLGMGVLSLMLDTTGKIVMIAVCMGLVFSFLIWAKYKQLHH